MKNFRSPRVATFSLPGFCIGDDDLFSWQLICPIGLIIIGSISPAYHHGYIEGELLYTIGRLIFIIIPVRMCRIWIALERYIWIALTIKIFRRGVK
jgi:hypothetical protein